MGDVYNNRKRVVAGWENVLIQTCVLCSGQLDFNATRKRGLVVAHFRRIVDTSVLAQVNERIGHTANDWHLADDTVLRRSTSARFVHHAEAPDFAGGEVTAISVCGAVLHVRAKLDHAERRWDDAREHIAATICP